MTYEPLRWDSEFFGFPIARINAPTGSKAIADTVARADAEGIRCLYYLVPADDLAALHAALRQGFAPYDIRVEFERPLEAQPRPDTGATVRVAEPSDEPVLADLASRTITATRFAVDSHFPRDRIPLLYAEWVKRGLRGDAARRVLIADPAAGFVVCGLAKPDAVGSIELIGVATRFARQGISRNLMSEAHAIMLKEGCVRTRVVTQGRNLAAQGLYQSLGYKTRSVAWWLHRWHLS